MISIIVITAEHIGFVVILIFNRDIQTAHTLAELLRQEFALGFAAPTHINIGNIINSFPVLAFQQRRNACTICSLCIAKDAESRLQDGFPRGFRRTAYRCASLCGLSMFSGESTLSSSSRLINPCSSTKSYMPLPVRSAVLASSVEVS